jgi:hypothetical protein
MPKPYIPFLVCQSFHCTALLVNSFLVYSPCAENDSLESDYSRLATASSILPATFNCCRTRINTFPLFNSTRILKFSGSLELYKRKSTEWQVRWRCKRHLERVLLNHLHIFEVKPFSRSSVSRTTTYLRIKKYFSCMSFVILCSTLTLMCILRWQTYVERRSLLVTYFASAVSSFVDLMAKFSFVVLKQLQHFCVGISLNLSYIYHILTYIEI